MNSYRTQSRLLLAFLILVVAVLTALPLSAQADGDAATVKFVHALPGAGPVDVYIDGELTLLNLTMGAPSLAVQVPPGTHTVAVTQTGVTTTLWQQDISLSSRIPSFRSRTRINSRNCFTSDVDIM